MDKFILDENLTPKEAFIVIIEKIKEDRENIRKYFDIYETWEDIWRKNHPTTFW